MAQSSSYKQYARTNRVLTEESGFAGGMLWTGNNIDAAHLKAIVNCDYDDTTGHLKTRDPFINIENSPAANGFLSKSLNLRNYRLLGAYNICAFDTAQDDKVLDAGWLYIFSKTQKNGNTWETAFNTNDIACVYRDYTDTYHTCDLDVDTGILLRNVNIKHTLLLWENYLYAIGDNKNYLGDTTTPKSWLQVFRVEYVQSNNKYKYVLSNLDFKTEILPKINAVTLLEASVSGFNAARGNLTFHYQSTEVANNPSIAGLYITDTHGNIIISPRVGHTYNVNVITNYIRGDSYLAMFQLKEGTGASTTVEDSWKCYKEKLKSSNGLFSFSYKFEKKETVLGFAFYSTNSPAKTQMYATEAVSNLAPYVINASDNMNNLKVKGYDLSDVNGSCIWRNRMCIWGTENNNNCLFLSEVDDFYYYPVPNNIVVFDTNVISCIPYKNTLLVFTADKIYRLSENNDGTFTQDVVQNDMPLSKSDSAHLTAVKNMVLFKSGNYFYMVVPKSQSLTDELSIAPIYKNIASFLNALDKSILEVLQLMYPEYRFKTCTVLNNAPVDVYSEQDTVHILYDVYTTVQDAQQDGVKELVRNFKIFLNYNTNLRAWTLYVEDITTATLEVAALTASRAMSFIRITNTGLFDIVTQQHSNDLTNSFRVLLDTGYRTLASSIQKRFREIQIKLFSETENVTAFGTSFLVDGVYRRSYSKFQEVVTSDGVVSLMPELDLNTFITELSMPVSEEGDITKEPGSDAIELSDWLLDFSHFKRGAPVTIRIPVSGKGFNPRFILMMPNALSISINEINWVYRLMHGR